MIDFTAKTFGIISLGCDKNRVDSEKLMAIIKAKGCRICEDIDKVNVLVINTCAFLNDSREEAIDTVIECAEYKSANLEKIVVTGCLPQKFIGETYEALTEADVFLGINDYDKFFEVLEKSYAEGRANGVGCGTGCFFKERVISTPVHYAYLKIADGCNNHCTYCLIPKIRGKYVSYPMEALIEEAKSLGDISELIIVAQDITRYGLDTFGQNKLRKILQKLTALVNIGSVRLLYAYPDMIDDGLIAEIRDNPKIIKYLDIPFQHSEDGVLKRMGRRGSRAEYISLIKKLRANIPGIAIRSTFITGFPGETQEDFTNLCSFLKQTKLNNCGFFEYSREPDTPAYDLPDQIADDIKKERVEQLYKLQSEISFAKLKKYVGYTIKVICDGVDYENNCFVGRAYFQAPDIDGKVYFNAKKAVQGESYEVLIEDNDSYDLYGRCGDYEDE